MTADDLFSRAAAPLRMLQRVWRDRRGNVLMIAGFAMLPLTFATGMGIDYSRAMRLETKLASVADAASLAAVTQPMMEKPFLTACDAARRTFVSQVSGLEGLTLDVTRRSDFTIRITDTYASLPAATLTCSDLPLTLFDIGAIPLTRTAEVTFRGQSSNSFAGVLGIRTLTVKGTSTSRTVKAPYIDIHMALDTSQSMGLAATDQAAKDLWYWTGRLNGRSCQFGCHERDPKENYANEFIANYFKIPLRVNVLRDATTDMIDTAAAGQGAATNYQFALYRIGMNNGRYATGVDEYVKLTTDLTTLRSKVQTLSLSPNDGAVGFGDTDLPNTTTFVLPYIKATSTAVDDGTTQARARKFFFLITDGVTDLEGSGCTFGHCTKPMDPATCDAYKQKGITVGVVYTTFLPTKADPTNPANPALRDEYIKLVQPIATKIAPALQSCASPGWYFEASDGPTIHAAMQKLFTQASKQATIIQ